MREHLFFDNIRDAIKILRRGKVETTGSSGCISGSNVCSGGHTILWSGDPNYEIPAGYPCSCGRTKVHYEICATCGHKKMEFR